MHCYALARGSGRSALGIIHAQTGGLQVVMCQDDGRGVGVVEAGSSDDQVISIACGSKQGKSKMCCSSLERGPINHTPELNKFFSHRAHMVFVRCDRYFGLRVGVCAQLPLLLASHICICWQGDRRRDKRQ